MAASAKLTIRLTDGESRILRSQAIRMGLSLSAFARQKILHGGGADPVGTEQVVGQILPAIEARFDVIEEQIRNIRSEAQQAESRGAERLKQAANFLAQPKS